MAALLLIEGEQPQRMKLAPVLGFAFRALSDSSYQHLAPVCTGVPDSFACFTQPAVANRLLKLS